MNKNQLWIGVGVTFLGLLTMKQLLFKKVYDEVAELRSAHNLKANAALAQVYRTRESFKLPPLTEEEKSKLRNHPDMLSVKNLSHAAPEK
jgi:hypothetical protein